MNYINKLEEIKQGQPIAVSVSTLFDDKYTDTWYIGTVLHYNARYVTVEHDGHSQAFDWQDGGTLFYKAVPLGCTVENMLADDCEEVCGGEEFPDLADSPHRFTS